MSDLIENMREEGPDIALSEDRPWSRNRYPKPWMKRLSLEFVGFLQAFALVVYCSLVGVLFWRGNELFGPSFTFLGPAVFLIIFVASAVISALLYLGYPFILFWEKKQTKNALKLVVYTTGWLLLFLVLFFLFSFVDNRDLSVPV